MMPVARTPTSETRQKTICTVYVVCSKKRQTETRLVRFEEESSELAVNDSNDEQDQDGDDGNGNDAVRSHPTHKKPR
jgi:hypothetical protein